MVNIPVYVVVSQWVALACLMVFVGILLRQLGYLFDAREQHHPKSGLEVGQRAPDFSYTMFGAKAGPQSSELEGCWTLLLFSDPLCRTCERAVASVKRLAETGALADFRVLIVTAAEPRVIAAAHEAGLVTGDYAVVSSEVIHGLYRMDVAPYLCLVDPSARISSKGGAESEEQVLSLVRDARERSRRRAAQADTGDPILAVGGN